MATNVDWVQIKIKAKDLSKLDLRHAIHYQIFGQRLAANLRQRLDAGRGTLGPIPKSRPKMHRIRPSWRNRYKTSQTRPRELPTPRSEIGHTRQTPASVFERLREIGGHFERARAGKAWSGYDHTIRYGWDAGREQAGKIWGYVWLLRERFVRSNYGPRIGFRTGKMRRAITHRVKVRGREVWVSAYVRGADPGQRSVTGLLATHRRKAERAKDAGRKAPGIPNSYKAAILDARDRHGKSGRGSGRGVGWIIPPDRDIQRLVSETMTDDVRDAIRKLPVKLVTKGKR